MAHGLGFKPSAGRLPGCARFCLTHPRSQGPSAVPGHGGCRHSMCRLGGPDRPRGPFFPTASPCSALFPGGALTRGEKSEAKGGGTEHCSAAVRC